jgi:exopolysaccharide biosynthesis polyprenyl glycosylphosphotransferase
MKPIAVSEKPHSAAEQAGHFRPQVSAFPSKTARPGSLRRLGPFGKVAAQDWAPALLLFLCDVGFWIAIYGSLVFFRRDLFFSSGFEFAVIDTIQLAVIVQALFIIGGYSFRTEMRGLAYTAEHILAMLAALAVSSLVLYAAATFDTSAMKPSRGSVLLGFIVFTPVSLVYRRALRKRVVAASASRAFLVIGAGALAKQFYERYKQSPNEQRLEFVDNDPARVGSTLNGEGTPIVQGGIDAKLSRLDRSYRGVILAEPVERLSPQLLAHLIRIQFQNARVYTLESFYEAQWRYVPVEAIDPVWPLQSGFQLARISPYHYLKRLLDLFTSGFLLVICSPLIVLLACLIWLTNGRPAIFRQIRVGREGHAFTAYKFRTMQMRFGENDDIYTRSSDPRVTRLGRWLRKLRLDELPQLWNVLTGQMSLIGPRAEWIKCTERYEKKIPFYHFRHLVKPGITGWAQVNYPYGESEEDAMAKLQYDLYYIRHYSLKLDAMIVLKTVHTMLFGKGR